MNKASLATAMAVRLRRRLAVESAPYHVDAYDGTPMDQKEIPQGVLDLANRSRRNLFPWRGQFSPELVEAFLWHYAADSDHVADPFAGVGTTLFEAARRGLPATGLEINPAAVVMAESIQFAGMSQEARRQACHKARAVLEREVLSRMPLFRGPSGAAPPLVQQVARIARDLRPNHPAAANVVANVLIRAMATRQPVGPDAFLRALRQHEAVILHLPHSGARYEMYLADAREGPLQAGACNLVVTSPPYINVFNYHQNHRPAMELLGWNVLEVAKSELGANRKHRGNRFLTVVQYCLDMAEALLELRRMLADSGRAIVVMGRESNVRGVSFRNGCIVGALAAGAGLDLAMRQERKFQNKFGQLIYEDILHLKPRRGWYPATLDFEPRALAVYLLEQALDGAQGDVTGDIRGAIKAADSVAPSPHFAERACQRP
jgi:hypothetical protein